MTARAVGRGFLLPRLQSGNPRILVLFRGTSRGGTVGCTEHDFVALTVAELPPAVFDQASANFQPAPPA